MNIINLKSQNLAIPLSLMASITITALAWWLISQLQVNDTSIGMIDLGVLQVIALAFSVWLALLAITMSIISLLLAKIISQLTDLFEPIKKLTSWQHHILYMALFALLVLSGTGCLIAIC